MSFDFTQTGDFGHDAIKWNRYAGRDILPLWIADMDFAAPPALVAALQRRVARAAFGYAEPLPSLIDTLCQHLEDEYAWSIEPEWIVWLPGLVTGLNVACRAVSGAVFSATPVYPPFLGAPTLSGKPLTTAPLACTDGYWHWDIPRVTAALRPDTRLFLLCHPHNPVGRAWHEAELQKIAALAERHDLIVCSDEIHSGLMLDARPHRPFATLSAAAAQRSITLMAPSKTFNMAGLGCAFALIPEARLRAQFKAAMAGIVPHVNALGLAACEAAYADCQDWHTAVLTHLRDQRDHLETRIAQIHGLRMSHVEATYLAWIDARVLCATRGITHPQRFFEDAGVGLSAGSDFACGSGAQNPAQHFVRLNFACPRATLDQALDRLETATR
ncbi:MAG: PatB family C-S lyase [Sterolibacterium sp.]|jgi:cystathionine beta-lyase|nr:PatB family C-S lyase [Sterolibacterium sp.]